ncbi:MAG: hypothetical protein ACJ79A_12880 [Gemmatimonadaceae bacterium]
MGRRLGTGVGATVVNHPTETDTTARAGESARAVVWAGGVRTEYLRAGSGAVVVLLLGEYDGPRAMELIELISSAFLVIAPSVPRGVAFASWLSDLMDGLGIASACIVAATTFFAEAERFAAAEEGRVHRVASLEARPAGTWVVWLRE